MKSKAENHLHQIHCVEKSINILHDTTLAGINDAKDCVVVHNSQCLQIIPIISLYSTIDDKRTIINCVITF